MLLDREILYRFVCTTMVDNQRATQGSIAVLSEGEKQLPTTPSCYSSELCSKPYKLAANSAQSFPKADMHATP